VRTRCKYSCTSITLLRKSNVIQLLVIFHILFVHVIFPYFYLHTGYRCSKVSACYGISCRLVEIRRTKNTCVTRAFARFFYEHSRIKDINVTARDLIKTKTRRLLRLHSTLGRRSATVTNAILESSGGHF